MEGEENLRRYSPEVVVRGPSVRQAIPLLPRIILFHGTADYSIPSSARFVSLEISGCWSKQSLNEQKIQNCPD